jgi:GT2 family glycosyltransferase
VRYSYVCTNYNNSRFTVDAVTSLMQTTPAPARIVVVDNASQPADRAELQRLADAVPQVELVLSNENSGYFPGLNKGIAHLRSDGDLDQWVVIGNNDLRFPAAFGEQLVAAAVARACDPVISPNVTTLDGVHQNPHVINGLSRARELMYDVYYSNYHLGQAVRWLAAATRGFTDRTDEDQHDIPRYIYQGHGSVYVLSPQFFALFGEFDAPTFMMGEEFFLSRQLAAKGHKVWYEPSLHVQHCCNGAIRSIPSRVMWERAREAHREYRRYIKPWHKQG